jgi:hypothetical protein
VLIAAPIYSILFSHNQQFINGGDTDWYFNAELYLNRALYNWWDVSFGLQNNLHFTSLYSVWQLLIALIFPENSFLGQRIFILVYIVLIFISSYKLVILLTTKNEQTEKLSIDSVLISLLYFYNIVFFFFIHHIQFKTLILYTFLPILTYLLMIFVKNGRYKDLLYSALVTLAFVPALGHFQVLVIYYSFVIIYVFIYYISAIEKAVLFKRILIFTFVVFGILFAFLAPAIVNQLSSELNDLTTDYSLDTLQNRYNDVLNSFQFVGGYGWKFYDQDYIGRQSFEYKNIFSGVGSVLLLIPFALLTLCLYITKRNSKSLLYLIVVTLSIILLSGPFYLKINSYLPMLLAVIFRSFFNFYLIVSILLLLIFASLYNENKRLRTLIIISLTIYYSSFLYIIVTGELINKYWYLGEEKALKYEGLISQINDDETLFRILNRIPDNKYNEVYVRYEDYFIGPDYYFSLLNNALISNFANPSLNQKSLEKFRSILNVKDIQAAHANIRYIMQPDSAIDSVDSQPRIISSGGSFQRVSPAKYRIYLSGISATQTVVFLESFHKEWNIYLRPNTNRKRCNIAREYTSFNTIECSHKMSFFEGDELSYIFKMPIFDDTHDLVYEYANSWKIDPQYIQQNFSKEYYEQNDDGTINIELVMYFKPQSYFYMSIIVTGTIIAICSVYAIRYWGL